MVNVKEGVVVMSERFSTLSAIHEKKMRIISGITGLNLLREGNSDEASTYIQSFVKLKDYPIEYLALNLSPRLPAEKINLESGARLCAIAKEVSGGSLSDEEMRKYADELAGMLYEAKTGR